MPTSSAHEIMASVPYRYAEDVLSGKIIAPKTIQQQAQHFLDDLKAAETGGFPYVFNLDLGLRPVKFTEQFLTPSKGNYDRMELLPWQQFVDVQAFGWVSRSSNYRRYREVLEMVARGNGKTTRAAGKCGFMVSKDGERGAEVYMAANSKDQTKRFYSEVMAQIETSAALARHFDVRAKRTTYPETRSYIEPLSNNAAALDGLAPHFVLKDELQAEETFDQISQLRRPMKKRRQPMAWYLCTAGTVLDGPLMYYYNFAKDILADSGVYSERARMRFLPIIYELDAEDDIEDTGKWIKANPSLGRLLFLEDLIDDWETSKRSPQERGDFVTKQLDRFANAGNAAFVDYPIIRRNRGRFDEQSLIGRPCYAGFDLSNTEDFTSAALEFELDGGYTAVLQHSWVPEDKAAKGNEKGIDYNHCAMMGWLDIVPGEYVEYEAMLTWFKRQAEKYRIRSIGYDPANAPMLVRHLKAAGLPCEVVRQGPLTLNGPMKSIREMLIDGGLMYNGDALFEWYLRNVQLRQDFFDREKENWMPTKRNRYKKIDGFMAFLFAHTERIRHQAVTGPVRDESSMIAMKLQRRA